LKHNYSIISASLRDAEQKAKNTLQYPGSQLLDGKRNLC
jgi:hypothetical protein